MARYSKQKSRMNRDEHPAFVPMLKTVEQMALISGIGENKLRQLMADGELEFIENGNRRLISEQAIWDYYNRTTTFPVAFRLDNTERVALPYPSNCITDKTY